VLEANPEDWARVIVTLRQLEVPGEHAGCDATRFSSVASDKLSMLRLPIFINKYLCNTRLVLFKISQIPWVVHYISARTYIIFQYLVGALFFSTVSCTGSISSSAIFKYSVKKDEI
jgi:hypothetical protein